jgi:ATP synthase protein I
MPPHLGKMDIRAKAYRIVAGQLTVTVLIALGWLAFAGAGAAWAALVGGLIAAAGSLIFARWLVRAAGRTPGEFAQAFYIGEGLKIVVTAVLFWVAIALLNVAPAPLFITYAVTLIVNWLALLPGMSGAALQQRQ